MYKIKEPYTTAMYLLKPVITRSMGVPSKTFPECKDASIINCSFKTYGGTVTTTSNEKDVNGLLAVVDTANVETWYNPDITSDCRLAFDDDNQYEIIGAPENVSMRNKTMKIKVKKVTGNA